MSEERITKALERIENALDRVEAAAGDGTSVRAELRDLKARHLALRTHIEGAISEIDRMLEAPEKA